MTEPKRKPKPSRRPPPPRIKDNPDHLYDAVGPSPGDRPKKPPPPIPRPRTDPLNRTISDDSSNIESSTPRRNVAKKPPPPIPHPRTDPLKRTISDDSSNIESSTTRRNIGQHSRQSSLPDRYQGLPSPLTRNNRTSISEESNTSLEEPIYQTVDNEDLVYQHLYNSETQDSTINRNDHIYAEASVYTPPRIQRPKRPPPLPKQSDSKYHTPTISVPNNSRIQTPRKYIYR